MHINDLDDALLQTVLECLDSSTILTRAALVCKRWKDVAHSRVGLGGGAAWWGCVLSPCLGRNTDASV